MRVIAGAIGGRTFVSPHGHRTRPMSEKVRGAMFNAFGDIRGLSVLDAFAGSGALSYEAISRGAANVIAIDSSKPAQDAIQENIKSLRLGKRIKLIRASANAWLTTAQENFDIVICDPPYDDLQLDLIFKLAGRLNAGGLLVLSLPPKTSLQLPSEYSQLSSKNYGDAELIFYRRAF